jgi:DNA-binding protein H-NS
VARQLAIGTVVKWFGNLSFDEQRDALGQIQREHDQSRATKRAELEKQLADLGYDAPQRRGRPKSIRPTNGAAQLNGNKASVKAKYRDSKTGDAWSGRGRMATWLKSKKEAGEKIEKYLV